MWGVSWCTCDCSSRTGGKTVLLLLCYYIIIWLEEQLISCQLLKRHASKLIHLEALYHQSLLHRSHTPYQAPPHKDTVELLLWDTPIQGTLPFKRHKIWSHNQDTSLFWVKGHFSASQNPGLTSIQGTPWLLRGNSPQKGLMSLSVH